MEVTIPGIPGILPWYLTSYVAVGGCVGTAVPTPVAFAPQWPWLSVLFYIGAVGSSRMGCGDALEEGQRCKACRRDAQSVNASLLTAAVTTGRTCA